MSKWLYQLLLWVALPWVLVRLWWRARREPEYGQRIGERFGRLPKNIQSGCICFHTVSAGETIAAAPLIATLAEEFSGGGRPSAPFLVTTMTPTGSAQVQSRLLEHAQHCYAPYDFRFAVRRFFDAVRPKLLVLMETELWPNLIDEAHARDIPVLLVNARLSERSQRGYARVSGLTGKMLQQVRCISCQYPDHALRFKTLGATDAQVSVLGNVKFDVRLPLDHAERVASIKTALGLNERPVWIAGSTHPGEEEIVLQAHQTISRHDASSCLLLVPRHPVRGLEVAMLARELGFSVTRQSTGTEPGADVVICDTMGQLQTLYGLSKVAFLGGSLVSVGGHNPIEAAICAQPVIMGPATFNFPDVVAAFVDAECLTTVRNASELADAVIECFENESVRVARGERARRVVSDNRGATERLLDLLRAEIRAAIT